MAGHKKRGGHEEEHENHERWLISYADMITLLFVLFVVMFALSTVDQKKFDELAAGMSAGAGAPRYVAMAGADSPFPGSGQQVAAIDIGVPRMGPVAAAEVESIADTLPVERTESDLARAEAELNRLDGVAEQIQAALAEKGLEDRASYRVTTDGLVVVLVADDVFFANGSAEIQPVGAEVVDAIAPALARSDAAISAEGHANHLPVGRGSIYPSNWELSAARAAAVVRRLVEVDGLDPGRLDATGYSDTRPLVPKDDPVAIETNRRVDLLVRSTESADVRALLPTLEATRS
ncbi:flagellar motor protein MotB [Aquipuribacter sp. MA13-6]|uniref:flagellar motor protein MotB n=1 Tax=unclassified Aquipuribacter TaxID=2635084 RepID=UPI003EEA9262